MAGPVVALRGLGSRGSTFLPSSLPLKQVMTLQEEMGKRVSNVVFMGMGEPLLNLPAVLSAFRVMRDQLGISGRAITVSTVIGGFGCRAERSSAEGAGIRGRAIAVSTAREREFFWVGCQSLA